MTRSPLIARLHRLRDDADAALRLLEGPLGAVLCQKGDCRHPLAPRTPRIANQAPAADREGVRPLAAVSRPMGGHVICEICDRESGDLRFCSAECRGQHVRAVIQARAARAGSEKLLVWPAEITELHARLDGLAIRAARTDDPAERERLAFAGRRLTKELEAAKSELLSRERVIAPAAIKA